ncbi:MULTISPECIES: MFS transporter [unclassified Arthrobacter]|uniref:MFS transporter n=1 Tax=unclassified Arthrobacter TaxID=235627 RepID=UPI00159E42D5|nr:MULTISPECIES: MFS transporter [unclassified Arthrobacter]MCQ9165834.1 MFS transporter [Arthrobacter sp. STN4]NVM99729.1 MFS transporter [Arthrobacter sp. SDTb3-6]
MSANQAGTAAPAAPWAGHQLGSAGYRRVLAALACAGVATFAQLYAVQGLLPLLSRDLHVTAAQAALTISAATMGLAVAVLPWSFVADRVGRVRTMGLAVILATIFGLLVPAAPNFEVLLALRALEGAALGGIPALAIAYLTEEISPRNAAAAAGAYVAGTTLGGLFGRLLAGPVADLAGWRMGTLAVSVCAAVAAAGFLLLAPGPRGFVPVRGGGGFGMVLARLVPQLRNKSLLALYAQAFLLMGAFVSVYNYLGFRLEAPPYLLPASAVALLFLAYLAGTVSSRTVAGLAVRFGRRTLLLASTALMAVGLAVTLAPALPVILVGLVLFTAGFFGAHSIASGWTGAMATSGRAQASSLYNLSYYAGSSVVGWAAGLVFQAVGWTALAAALAGLALLAAAAAATLLPPGRPRS